MAPNEVDQAAGSAIAAFTLVQTVFWHLLKESLLPMAEAERMLQDGVQANKAGGRANQIAASMLAEVLKNVQAHHQPKRH